MDALVNFNLSKSKNYALVQKQLLDVIKRHLPQDSWRESHEQYVEGCLNFTLFIAQEADVLMSHGAADKSYHWKSDDLGRRFNHERRRSHLLVPGQFLVDRIVSSRSLRFDSEHVHSVGWPRLDLLLEAQRQAAKASDASQTSRKKVLWAPSHDYSKKGDEQVSLSSYPEFVPYVDELRKRYDVDVSLHPRNRGDKAPTKDSLVDCDVVITDFGTMVYEAWALGKQVIFPFWLIGERMLHYGKGSFEAKIFRERIGLHADSFEQMCEFIDTHRAIEPAHRQMIDHFLEPSYLGCSGKRIADLLLDLAQQKRGRSQNSIYTKGTKTMELDGRTDAKSGSAMNDETRMDLPFTEGNPLADFRVDESRLMLTEDGRVPLIHWPVAPNFGDLLSPWLISKLTGRETFQNRGEVDTYIAIGSVIKRVRDRTSVWGTGSFGDERKKQLNPNAKYHAVRGPLTRVKLSYARIDCPRVYGDPALLVPYLYKNTQKKKYKTGFVIRWSDKFWKNLDVEQDVAVIDLKTSDIEGTLDMMLQCEKIVTSSLHGLVIADAYGIPNAWVESSTPRGGEFKYYDYFLSVDKVRHVQPMPKDISTLSEQWIVDNLDFDARPIKYDPYPLLDACPFLSRKDRS